MDGSLLQFVLAVFTAMLLQTWYLHREIHKSRQESMRHTDRSHDQLRTDFTEHKEITERNHRETQRLLANLADGLGDARERLARIEGYLRIGLPEPPDAAADG
ncbi:MAG: hypothetical protein OXC06_08975 [Acidimicrobiaceae bacterium]|nr:hypothetical protein [Acidimicrobiaceae bacterium]